MYQTEYWLLTGVLRGVRIESGETNMNRESVAGYNLPVSASTPNHCIELERSPPDRQDPDLLHDPRVPIICQTRWRRDTSAHWSPGRRAHHKYEVGTYLDCDPAGDRQRPAGLHGNYSSLEVGTAETDVPGRRHPMLGGQRWRLAVALLRTRHRQDPRLITGEGYERRLTFQRLTMYLYLRSRLRRLVQNSPPPFHGFGPQREGDSALLV